MNDLRPTIVPKSDQLNADDLIGTTRTIKVSKVLLTAEADQPVALGYEGDNGKPYKPCKSMRRVLVTVWGPDGNQYVGRRLTLYRDDKVQFGGLAVGGIRISHMSDIDKDVTMALTASRANRKPFTVRPMAAETQRQAPAQAPAADSATGEIEQAVTEGAASDYADLLEFEIDGAEDAATTARIINAAMKTDDWKALRASAPARAAELKTKAGDKVAALKEKVAA